MSAHELITEHLDLWTQAATQKSTAGRGRSGKIELTGIKKLRELILELAVRGKLVEQDANDEPAQELLEQCLKAKAISLEIGKLKKARKHTTITSEDIPSDQPKCWVFSRLDDLVRVINGRAYKKHEMLSSGTPLLRVGNLFTSNDWYYSDLELEEDKYIDSGDLIYAWSASFGPFIWNGGRAIYHYHIWKLDLYDETAIDKRFLYLYLTAITEEIKSSGSGIAMIHMTKAKMEELIVPVPPLEEQHRIVQKVDELMALCDRLEQHTSDQLDAHETLVDTLLGCLLKPAEGSLTQSANATELADNWARLAEHFDTLFTTEQSIDKLKQTILQLAVMGRLVEQDAGDESVISLLEQHYITSKTCSLNGWAEVSLGNLGTVLGGSTPTKSKSEFWNGSIPWVSPKDMKCHLIKDSQIKVTEHALSQSNLKLVPENSLIMVVRGMILAHSFPVAITGCEITINQDMKALTPPDEISKYLLLYLKASKHKVVGLVDRSSHGTCKLISEKLWSLPIFLPPLEEQHRIVQKVDELMAICDHLKERLNHASETRCQLAGAVVEGAIL